MSVYNRTSEGVSLSLLSQLSGGIKSFTFIWPVSSRPRWALSEISLQVTSEPQWAGVVAAQQGSPRWAEGPDTFWWVGRRQPVAWPPLVDPARVKSVLSIFLLVAGLEQSKVLRPAVGSELFDGRVRRTVSEDRYCTWRRTWRAAADTRSIRPGCGGEAAVDRPHGGPSTREVDFRSRSGWFQG